MPCTKFTDSNIKFNPSNLVINPCNGFEVEDTQTMSKP